MFVYFGCVFLEVVKAQISKANYQEQKHEFLPHDCVFKTYDFAGSLYKSSLFFSVRRCLASAHSLNHKSWVTESRLEKPNLQMELVIACDYSLLSFRPSPLSWGLAEVTLRALEPLTGGRNSSLGRH